MKRRFILLLRGINVSGKNLLRMNLLKEICEGVGFEQATTYIQSGNVVFCSAETSISQMELRVKDAIREMAGLDVPVMVIETHTLEAILQDNPFKKELAGQSDKLHVTLLSEVPHPDRLAAIDSGKYLPDRFISTGRSIYLYCPNGYGQTKLTNTFFESKLRVTATTRNLKTLNHLLSIAAS